MGLQVHVAGHQAACGGWASAVATWFPWPRHAISPSTRRKLVTFGADPIEHRKATVAAEREAYLREQASKMTFGMCVEQYLAEHLDSFRNAKHQWQWKETLQRASDAFGDLNVGAIDAPMVIKFLTPIWHKTPETGSRIRGRVEKVLDWAKVHQFRDGENPARWKGHLEHVFASAKGGNYAAMPFTELPAFMARLRERDSVSARALELLILTAARSGEIRGATWQEVDLDKALWTIPGERMKAGKRARRSAQQARRGAIEGAAPHRRLRLPRRCRGQAAQQTWR